MWLCACCLEQEKVCGLCATFNKASKGKEWHFKRARNLKEKKSLPSTERENITECKKGQNTVKTPLNLKHWSQCFIYLSSRESRRHEITPKRLPMMGLSKRYRHGWRKMELHVVMMKMLLLLMMMMMGGVMEMEMQSAMMILSLGTAGNLERSGRSSGSSCASVCLNTKAAALQRRHKLQEREEKLRQDRKKRSKCCSTHK